MNADPGRDRERPAGPRLLAVDPVPRDHAYLVDPLQGLISEVAGAGDFATVLGMSVLAQFSYGTFRFLNLDALIASKQATGRDRDLTALRHWLSERRPNARIPDPV